MEAVMAPVFHTKDAAGGALLAVKTTEPPLQNVVGPEAVTDTKGVGFTVTTTGVPEPVQPAAVVTVTLYEPVPVAVIDAVVAPVFHWNVAPGGALEADNTTDPPEQKVVGPEAVMLTTGLALTVTLTGVPKAVQPFKSVMVTL